MSRSTIETHRAVSVSITTRVHATFFVTRISIADADGGVMEINAYSDDPLPLDLQPMQDLRGPATRPSWDTAAEPQSMPCVTESAQ